MQCNLKKHDITEFSDLANFLKFIESDFLLSLQGAKFNSWDVHISPSKNDKGFNGNIWHCVYGAKDEYNNERAEKLAYIRILNGCENTCSEYIVKTQSNNRYKIICKKKKYCVILEKRSYFYILITAFPLYKF